jgi:hypothetical protein
MKYCPQCDEHYDEDIIRFCTKDGTPLVEEDEPKFTALPSENLEEPDDDIGEATIIRTKPVTTPFPGDPATASGRIVIPTSSPAEQQVRPRTVPPPYYPPPPPPNTGKTVALTILGTLVVLGFGAGLFWLLQKEAPANTNINLNTNLGSFNGNLNGNSGFDSNFNFNAATNFNINTNLNANLKTPTPSPTPKASPSPSASPTATPVPSPTPTRTPTPTRPTVNTQPSPSPTPRMGPRPPGNGNNT